MSKRGHSFNVVLDATQITHLGELATRSKCSQAQIIRFALRDAWNMVFRHKPTCADGSRCFVPHMHPQPDTHPQPHAPLLTDEDQGP